MKKYHRKLDNQTFVFIFIITYVYFSKYFEIISYSLIPIILLIIYTRIRKLSIWFKKNQIDLMDGIEFEKYVAKTLTEQGFSNVRLTEKYDLGIDIIAIKDNIRYGIQVKRYSYPVKADAVRQAVTALNYYNCDKAMVITNSTFTKTAIKLAQSNGCSLIGKGNLTKAL